MISGCDHEDAGSSITKTKKNQNQNQIIIIEYSTRTVLQYILLVQLYPRRLAGQQLLLLRYVYALAEMAGRFSKVRIRFGLSRRAFDSHSVRERCRVTRQIYYGP